MLSMQRNGEAKQATRAGDLEKTDLVIGAAPLTPRVTGDGRSYHDSIFFTSKTWLRKASRRT